MVAVNTVCALLYGTNVSKEKKIIYLFFLNFAFCGFALGALDPTDVCCRWSQGIDNFYINVKKK